MDPAKLGELTDWIHDCWFDLEEVAYDEDILELRIPFDREFYDEREVVSDGLIKTVRAPMFECQIVFRNVTNYTICDSENVGMYDFSEVEAMPAADAVKIRTNIPLDFRIECTPIDIRIEKCGSPLNFKTHRVIFN